MKIYPNLFAYLNNCALPIDTQLQARDRPIISLNTELETRESFLIPVTNSVYEIGFPYLKPADIIHHNQHLEYVFNLSIGEHSYALRVTDEVLDLDTIKEENELPEWEEKLGKRLDNTNARLIRLLVGMFASLFCEQMLKQPQVCVIKLPEKLNLVNVDEANLPLVVSLERRYQLRRKLEAIASKLRHQLRRQAELMPVGRIQEMDAYCLRDYIRRPGQSAAEKAGSKQELMGIQRYQDFNTAENKFLLYFSQILHLGCYRYERSGARQYRGEIQKFRLVIDLFKQQPVVQGIQDRQYQFTKPNYVLQQNPIYRSFYLAYLEYIQKRYEKERVWLFRNQLLADTVNICLTAALLRFQGVKVDSIASITGIHSPDKGRYIQDISKVSIRVFLKDKVYVFRLKQSAITPIHCDLLLTVEIHNLDSNKLEIEELLLPIWVFWYRPTDEAIAQATIYLQKSQFSHNVKRGIIFYLQIPPTRKAEPRSTRSQAQPGSEYTLENKLWLCQLPDLIAAQGFSSTVEFMAQLIKQAVECAL